MEGHPDGWTSGLSGGACRTGRLRRAYAYLPFSSCSRRTICLRPLGLLTRRGPARTRDIRTVSFRAEAARRSRKPVPNGMPSPRDADGQMERVNRKRSFTGTQDVPLRSHVRCVPGPGMTETRPSGGERQISHGGVLDQPSDDPASIPWHSTASDCAASHIAVATIPKEA